MKLSSIVSLVSLATGYSGCLKDKNLAIWLSQDGTDSGLEWINGSKSITFFREVTDLLALEARSIRVGMSMFGHRVTPPTDMCYMDVIGFSASLNTAFAEMTRYLRDFRVQKGEDGGESLSSMAYIAANKFGRYNPSEVRIILTIAGVIGHFAGDEHGGDMPLPVQPTQSIVCDEKYTYVDRMVVATAMRREGVIPVTIVTESDKQTWRKLMETMNMGYKNQYLVRGMHDITPKKIAKEIIELLEKGVCGKLTTTPRPKPESCVKSKDIALWYNQDGTRTFGDLLEQGIPPSIMSNVWDELSQHEPKSLEFGMSVYGDRQEKAENTCYIDVLKFTADRMRGMRRVNKFLTSFTSINGVDDPEDGLDTMAYIAAQKFGNRSSKREVRILITLADYIGHFEGDGFPLTGGSQPLPLPATSKVMCDRRFTFSDPAVVGRALRKNRIIPLILTFRQHPGHYSKWVQMLESMDIFPELGQAAVLRLDGMDKNGATDAILETINELICKYKPREGEEEEE